MKLKTEQEIGLTASEYADQSQKNKTQIAWVLFDVKEAYKKGYTQAQQDLLASAGDDWDEWWEDDKDIPEMLARASGKVAAVTNMAQRCSLLSEFWAREAWQAAKLSDAKEIEELEKRNNNQAETMKFLSSITNVKDAEIETLTKEKDAWKTMYLELKSRVAGA